MLAKLVTLFVCLAMIASPRPATDADAGFLAFDPGRADLFWRAGEVLGCVKPGERPWWEIRRRADWTDPVWAYRIEVWSLRTRARTALTPQPAGAQ